MVNTQLLGVPQTVPDVAVESLPTDAEPISEVPGSTLKAFNCWTEFPTRLR